MCGGALDDPDSQDPAGGLSPRVRGSRQDAARRRRCGGSIPACAGEPVRSPRRDRVRRVYPRVCGGALLAFGALAIPGGLSPRVRGSPDPGRQDGRPGGSIPACAGGAATRVCAECHAEGLSPRVRGSHHPVNKRWIPVGSIPACAGEPAEHDCGLESHRVYPRVCGGARTDVPLDVAAVGLSPRVRGSPSDAVLTVRMFGSIPACAGEPPRRMDRAHLGWVYPRVCGGANRIDRMPDSMRGLSPRVRGSQALGLVRTKG